MKLKILLSLLFLFIGIFAYSIGLNSRILANDPPDCRLGLLYSCCLDSLERRGAWLGDPPLALTCKCDGVPGYPTIGGPCNCPMDCYSSGEPH